MTRLARSLILALVAALLVAATGACSVANPTALTVGSWTLSQSDFLDTVAKVSAKPVVAKQFDQTFTGAGTGASSSGTTPVAYPTSLTAALLSAFTQFRIWSDEAARLGITITDQQRQSMRGSINSQLANSASSAAGASASASTATADDLGALLPVAIDGLIAEEAIQDRLLDPNEVTSQARRAYEANRDRFIQSCSLLILVAPPGTTTTGQVPTAAQLDAVKGRADAVKARLDGGADFAAVAASDSDDPKSKADGGKIPCQGQSAAAQLPQEISDALFAAPVGTVSGPIRLSDGFYFLKVTSRDATPFEQLQDQLETQVKQQVGQSVMNEAYQKAAANVPVTVNPLYGTWDPAKLVVDPPSGAQAPPTTAPVGSLGNGGISVRTGPDGQPQLVGPDGQPIDVSSLGAGQAPGGAAAADASGGGAASSGASGASGAGAGGSGSAPSSSGAPSSSAAPSSSTPSSSTPATSTAGSAARP